MAANNKEELIRIMHKGYCAALDSCCSSQALYVKGFIDGMNYQEDGTIPKSNFDKMLEKFENGE